MTIGANLNGGSLTLGAAGATTSINSNITNVGSYGLPAAGRINIGSGTNATNTEMFLGSTTLSYNNIRGNIIHIADTGLSATGKVHIASGVNGGNATGSEIKIGDGASSTNLKGNSVVINSDTNGNTIIGNTTGGYTYIKGSNVGLGDDGGTIAIGSTSPLSGTTSILNIRTPITIGYGMPGSASQLGGQLDHTTVFISDSSPTFTGFAYINAVPTGRYICQAIVYYGGTNPSMWIYTSLAIKSSAIGHYQQGLVALGDNALETFSTKPNNVDRFSVNPSCVYSFTAPNNNVALGVQSSAWSAGLYTRLTLTRIA